MHCVFKKKKEPFRKIHRKLITVVVSERENEIKSSDKDVCNLHL